jgi:hypothetical protein
LFRNSSFCCSWLLEFAIDDVSDFGIDDDAAVATDAVSSSLPLPSSGMLSLSLSLLFFVDFFFFFLRCNVPPCDDDDDL